MIILFNAIPFYFKLSLKSRAMDVYSGIQEAYDMILHHAWA